MLILNSETKWRVGSPVSYRRENGTFEKGKIVDLKVDEASSGSTAVLQAKIRYETEAGAIKAKWCPLNIDLRDIEAPSITHKFVAMEDMPIAAVPSHPTDGREFLTAVHDHFESGNGSAEALAKAHERVAGIGVPLVAAGASMSVSGLTNSIRDHLSSTSDCNCDDDDEMSIYKKGCSGSDSRRRRMQHLHKIHGGDRRGRMHKSAGSALSMNELSEALVSTDKWFVNNLNELKETK